MLRRVLTDQPGYTGGTEEGKYIARVNVHGAHVGHASAVARHLLSALSTVRRDVRGGAGGRGGERVKLNTRVRVQGFMVHMSAFFLGCSTPLVTYGFQLSDGMHERGESGGEDALAGIHGAQLSNFSGLARDLLSGFPVIRWDIGAGGDAKGIEDCSCTGVCENNKCII